jgi:DNA-binding LacI/PurR family transcriptional regulator
MSFMRDKRVEVGMALPSLRVIGKHFKAGHATVQQTVNELSSKGYIVKQQGKGCFVKRKPNLRSRKLARRLSIPLVPIPFEKDYPRPQANIIAGISVGLGINGWTFQCVNCQSDGSEFNEILHRYCNGLTDGVILPGTIPNIKEHLHEAEFRGMPVILVNRMFKGVPSFTLSVGEACRNVAREFLNDGLDNFIVFRVNSENPRFYEIDESLSEILGISVDDYRNDSVKLFNPEEEHLNTTTAKMVEILKNSSRKPDVIFSSPEILTLATSNALRELDWESVRLVSVDDSPEVHHYSESHVFHVRTPYFQLGKKASEAFANELEKGQYPKNTANSISCGVGKNA